MNQREPSQNNYDLRGIDTFCVNKQLLTMNLEVSGIGVVENPHDSLGATSNSISRMDEKCWNIMVRSKCGKLVGRCLFDVCDVHVERE